ncbi:fungal transcriptional regulatory protein, partial [Metarhizium hybridum]
MYISTILLSLVSLSAIGDAFKQEQYSKLSPSIIGKSSPVPPSTPGTKRTAQAVLSGHVNVDDQCRSPSNDGQVDESSWDNAISDQIPEVDRMVSTLIYHPETEQNFDTNTAFSVDLTISNLFLVDNIMPYADPQRLDPATGQVRGHVYVVIQKAAGGSGALLGDDSVVYSARVPGWGNNMVYTSGGAMKTMNRLSVEVDGGLHEPGRYRVCTVATAENLQRVMMPSVTRGPQDDCIWFTVGDGVVDREVAIANPPRELVGTLQPVSLGSADHVNLSVSFELLPGLLQVVEAKR